MQNIINSNAQKKHDRTIISTLVYRLSKTAYRFAPVMTTRLLREKGFSVKPYALSAGQRQLLKQAESFTLEFNNNKIKVFEWGEGPVILLVHGWAGRALQMDAFVTPLVNQGYKVVAFDHKGHGESSTSYSSYPELVRGTRLVVEHYAEALHGVVAHSLGSNSLFKVSENIQRKIKIAVIAPLEDFLGMLERQRIKMGIYEKLFDSVVSLIETDSELRLAELTVFNYEKLRRHDVLLVHDKFDRVNKISASLEIHRNLHGSYLMQTEMLGHSRMLNDKAVVHRVAQHFS